MCVSHDGVFTLEIVWGCRRFEEASAFLQKSVKADCRERYWKSHDKCNDYRATLTEGDDPGEWFELCQSDESRIGEAVLFYRYLYETLQLREVQVSSVMSGVIFCMAVGGYDT